MQTGGRLRSLFAMILLFCNPSKPEDLWMAYRSHICDDLRYRLTLTMGFHNPTDADAYDYGLFLIHLILQQSGSSLSDYPGMPALQRDWSLHVENHYITEQLHYDPEKEQAAAGECIPLLNQEQQDAFNQIMWSVDKRTRDNILPQWSWGHWKDICLQHPLSPAAQQTIHCLMCCLIWHCSAAPPRWSNGAFHVQDPSQCHRQFCLFNSEGEQARRPLASHKPHHMGRDHHAAQTCPRSSGS